MENCKEILLKNMEKLLFYFMKEECKDKTSSEVQNINLEIQCSLNYTCPRCIKIGKPKTPQSLKVLDETTKKPDIPITCVPQTTK